MNMVLNEEQRLLKDTIQDFLSTNAPVTAFRKLRDTQDNQGYSTELWRHLCELGIAAIVMPEEHGGLGFGYLGLGAVLEECGKNLTASPLLASVVLGASALELAGNETQQSLLDEVASGSLTLALAIDEHSHFDPLQTRTSLTENDSGFTLNGHKVFVLDGHTADRLIVVTRSRGEAGSRDGLSLVMLDSQTPGVKIDRHQLMDGRNVASIQFEQVSLPADALLGELHNGFAVIHTLIDRAAICVAAEMLGSAQEVFDRTLEYLKEREQFGVKIGSFQALQHRCAQMLCQLEHCRSAVVGALAALDKGSRGVSVQASTAKALANDCLQHISNEAVQMHGGMGVTDELDIGLFLKRSRVCNQIFGDSIYHRDRFATLMGY
ncbi:acyl-CoA dehydrogenase [Aestuariicella hydrocarbonica]|uniref:Acyl-CoA dehydrogenase n=1 Tax=Pseudomaricurvus hydrocarbonicus TaxID=1470433 RepID=A0A9E5JSJ9_9GAMM|nr:acyl-CoA dehydrogenase family protein [Aestuariicella hydrocarbonica]NHO66042.1 acyl-CoA dehydrogenase [Aestuariicella hydrocarbonica]